MPIIKNKGVRDVYEVVKISTITSKEAHQVATDPDNDMRLAFTIRFHHQQFDDFRKIDQHHLVGYSFIDTTFDKLNIYIQ